MSAVDAEAPVKRTPVPGKSYLKVRPISSSRLKSVELGIQSSCEGEACEGGGGWKDEATSVSI